ncbi:MAG: phosphate acyltransferase PlsX [Clostridiales bacterium]|nr:phosphate acyltransferase PlsX [Clostridiales bacterium]
MKVLIDAFGGDHSPNEIIAGTVEAVTERNDFTAVLIGNPDIINEQLKNYTYSANRIEILPASEVITCEEEPTVAIRRKPDSTINVGFKELKENPEAKAFVSAGSTGAYLVGATLKLGRIKGVNRPALCPTMPTADPNKSVILLDAGANADCKAINLCQFAVMGSTYAKAMGVENPKVALLSNGTEDEKGNALVHEVLPMLKEMKSINFMGNCEARDILTGEYDVIVADGFSGNVAIKSIEGAVMTVMGLMKGEIFSTFKGKIGGLLLKDTFKRLAKKMDYNNNGGALFLGVEKVVIKAHGSSKRTAIKNAVLQAAEFASIGLAEKLKESIINESNF